MSDYRIGHSPFNPAIQSTIKHKFLLKNLAVLLSPCLILFMLLAGCGYTRVLKTPVKVSKRETPRKTAIFPLADYSQFQHAPFVEPYRDPNLLIVEEITQNLVGNGFNVAIQEDVNEVLFSEKVLLPVPIQMSPSAQVVKEVPELMRDPYGRLGGISFNPPHLEEMKEIYRKELFRKLDREPDMNSLSFQPQGVSKGLDHETLATLARKLDVDIVIRGRVLEYGFKDRPTMSLLHGEGILTFLIDEPKRIAFGVTTKDKYDTAELIRDAVESTLVGAAVGGGIGAAAHQWKRGSAIGAGLGVLRTGGRGQPHVESSVMHIRLYAQDAKTGQIIWTNAIEVERKPTSRFAFNDKHPKVLLDKLTRKGVRLLVSDFIKNAGL